MHIGGLPCDMPAIERIARDRGRWVGTLGDATAFSFYATKNLTTGEGGMLTTNDDAIADTVATLTLHGMSRDAWKRYSDTGSWWYDITAPGYKYNLPDLQAAIGLHQLRRATDLWHKRQRLARLYRERLADIPFVELPALAPAGDEHAWHLFTIRLRPETLSINRGQFIEALGTRGVSTSVHFIPVHMHSFYRDRLGYAAGAFPRAERTYSRIISLPFHTSLTEDDIDYVAEQIREVGRG